MSPSFDNPRGKENWKPRRNEWLLQEEVVEGLIGLLEQPECTVEDIAKLVHEQQIVRTSVKDVQNELGNMFRRFYKLPFDRGGKEAFLAELRKQLEWIRSYPDSVVPEGLWRRPDSFNDYHARRARKRLEGGGGE